MPEGFENQTFFNFLLKVFDVSYTSYDKRISTLKDSTVTIFSKKLKFIEYLGLCIFKFCI